MKFLFIHIFLFSILLFLFSCKSPTINNECDPTSKSTKDEFFASQLIVNNPTTDKKVLKLLFPEQISFCLNSSNNNASSVALTFSEFSVKGSLNNLHQDYSGTISGNSITISMPYGNANLLIPSVNTNAAKIQISGIEIQNGVTTVDFTSAKTMVLTSSSGSQQTYTITPYLLTPVADTGQTHCYINDATSAVCSAVTATMPNQDGELQDFPNAKNIQLSSTNTNYPNDPINIDKLKGIVWKTCHEGFTGNTCAGGAISQISFTSAETLCSNLNTMNSGSGYAGLKQWRLPTVHELNQLMEHNTPNVALHWNTTYFPNTPSTQGVNYYRWTSSKILPAASNTLGLNEYLSSQSLANSNPVQCVNGASPPSYDLLDNGDGTISDRRTKLTWQKCSRGQANDSGCTGALTQTSWAGALQYCNSLVLGSKNWRLPNLNEWLTMFDMSKPAPFFDTTLFPNLTTGAFHSSSTLTPNEYYNHLIDITVPNTQGISGKPNNYNVRCVSGP